MAMAFDDEELLFKQNATNSCRLLHSDLRNPRFLCSSMNL